jgi:hypothetical protein
MLKRKPNRKSARGADSQDEAKRGALAKRDVIPPEEFAGFDEFGEYPEFRPGDKAMQTYDADSEEHTPPVNIRLSVE